MTPVEKLAIQLSSVYFDGDPGPWMSLSLDVRVMLRRLARHVLRRERAAVRRARGRTLGWACHMNYEPLLTLGEAQMQVDACGGTLARVVAVPKPRKGGRK